MALIPGGVTIPQLSGDPVENPEANTVFLYAVGSSYKMKLSNGTILTFASGISAEDVQDIVGTFIQAGSSKISVAYNDALNVLTIDVVEANINLTKAQVGLANVDNTSDANKPISNATQSALNAKENTGVAASLISAHEGLPNPHPGYATDGDLSAGLALKYDLTNPSGFQTAAQVSTAANSAITTHESASNPHPVYETSVEAQAKVDAHANLTTNPHAVTKAQVGLSNVDNTSDINKPVSTATQNALNLKYDSSNPSGFETPTQLNARDTANRNRLNHTGVQLAATISDFAATVLGVLLTGFVAGANAAILATDSILAAFQKVQGQINAINAVLSTLVIGDQFQEFSDLTTFTTTANTNQVAATFTTASKPTGKYRVGITWDWSHNNATADSIYSVWMDGIQVSQEFRYELSDTATQLLNNHWFYYPTFLIVQTHTLELRCRAETAGQTVTVSQVRAEIWRAAP